MWLLRSRESLLRFSWEAHLGSSWGLSWEALLGGSQGGSLGRLDGLLGGLQLVSAICFKKSPCCSRIQKLTTRHGNINRKITECLFGKRHQIDRCHCKDTSRFRSIFSREFNLKFTKRLPHFPIPKSRGEAWDFVVRLLSRFGGATKYRQKFMG